MLRTIILYVMLAYSRFECEVCDVCWKNIVKKIIKLKKNIGKLIF